MVPIVLLAWASFRDDPVPEARFAPFVPFVGWFVIAVLVLAVGLRLYGTWRQRRRARREG